MTSKTSSLSLALLLLALAWPTNAAAMTPEPDVQASSEPTQFLELGLNLRTDLGVHPLRVNIGWRMPWLDVALTVDPMFWTDGQSSTDLAAFWLLDNGVHPYAGWRVTTIGLRDGTQLHQNLLLGVGMALPEFFDGFLRGQWGLELATTVVKSGGELPTEVISFGSARSYLDLVNFAMFARFDFNIGLL